MLKIFNHIEATKVPQGKHLKFPITKHPKGPYKHHIVVRVDTGADVNCMNEKTFNELFPEVELSVCPHEIQNVRNSIADISILEQFHTYLEFRGEKYLNTFIVTNVNDCPNLLSYGATFRMYCFLITHGISPDPKEIQALNHMEFPPDKETMRSFLGMINYLNRYSALSAHLAAPLSALTHQAADYKPGKVHFENFNRLKLEISNMKVLPYFDVNAETALQMDASKKGLGACLIQKGKVICYASRPSPRWSRITRIWNERH